MRISEGTKELDKSRDAIIASIRGGLAASRRFDEEYQRHKHWPSASDEVRAGNEFGKSELIGNFKQSLEIVGGHCRVVAGAAEAAEAVRALISGIGPGMAAISDSEIVKTVTAGADVIEHASKDELFACGLGITSAQWAIAETGTLVLESEKERHRLTSLIPRVHLCLVEASRIRQTLGEILELASLDISRTITFITGASRTSDIELTLAIGVHGPAELHVIVIADR